MVRKGIVKVRAGPGIIPSNNHTNDRARTVTNLFKIFSDRLPENDRPKMINFSTQILREGENKLLFSGKDPMISRIVIFLVSTEYFCPFSDNYVTRADIKREFMHFAGTDSFTMLKRTLQTEFQNYKIQK